MADKKACTLCEKIGLKPFTKENIYYYYIPIHGLVSYGGLSVNVMNPSLVSKVLSPKKDLTNVLLLSSVVGAAFYIYGRPSMAGVRNGKRGVYALMGGSLWAMGSVLFWAIMKSVLPQDNNAVATIAGLATGAAIVKVASDYFFFFFFFSFFPFKLLPMPMKKNTLIGRLIWPGITKPTLIDIAML